MEKDGSICNTPLQNELKLKIGAEVMLTSNIDVCDGLTNGAMGRVVGFEKSHDNSTKTVLIHFESEKIGRERRKTNSRNLQQRFPNIPVTPISKIDWRFNLSKSPTSQNDFCLAIQFPLKLCWAVTAHKIQGRTIPKPQKLIADLMSVREAAQAYVILSRVQALNQLYILKELPRHKIYPSPSTMEELDKLSEKALNSTVISEQENTMIVSLNIRSLLKHHSHILSDPMIKGDVIAVQETWCAPDLDNNHLDLPGYTTHFVSQGRGKGVATYFKSPFKVTGSTNNEKYQLSKISCKDYDIINVYRSAAACNNNFLRDLGKLALGTRPCYIVGDFNIHFDKKKLDPVITKICSNGFAQIIDFPTHIDGGVLDHVYIRKPTIKTETEISFPFYTDHAAILIRKI